jgi:hypothetical protein
LSLAIPASFLELLLCRADIIEFIQRIHAQGWTRDVSVLRFQWADMRGFDRRSRKNEKSEEK